MQKIATTFALSALCLGLVACGDEEQKAKAPAAVEKSQTTKEAEKQESVPQAITNVIKKTENQVQETVNQVEDAAKSVAAIVKEEASALEAKVVATLLPGDAVRGEKVFNKCKSCHDASADGKHKVGPNLFGVVGRTAGSAEGFTKYSKAMQAYATPWTAESISAYVLDPTAYLKEKTGDNTAKSKMTFKLKDEQDRKDVAAYIESLK